MGMTLGSARGRYSPVIEHLPGMSEVLGSIPTTSKKEN